MEKKNLSVETKFVRNLLIGFFSTLVIVLIGAFIALFQTLISHSEKTIPQPIIIIKDCYDGDTCTSIEGEKIRLACIDTPEIRGKRADEISAKAARDYLKKLVIMNEVVIRRIGKDRYGRTVAELYIDGENVQQSLLSKGHAQIYDRYSDQCLWPTK